MSLDELARAATGETLDPDDWEDLRRQSHRMLDDMLDYIAGIRARPVWQPIPDAVRARFRAPVPQEPTAIGEVYDEFARSILPYTVGNVHPAFMGWVHGGGTAVGMVAEMLAGGLNANLGGRDHMPIEVERQIAEWMRQILGFPPGASGLFVTGTSMANFLAVTIARTAAEGTEVRRTGVNVGTKRLIAYTSTAAHGCVAQAMDLSGLGRDCLRSVATDALGRMRIDALRAAIAEDRAAGRAPFMVLATAGTVDVGAIDDLAAVAALCRAEGLWFHIDAAYGALGMLAPDIAPRLAGIEAADSVACDFHKWGQVPYDAGFLLVRDTARHQAAFASTAAYLQRATRGLAAGSPWPCDLGPDLSRGFRALKTWFTLKTFGTRRIGATIARSCAVARYLEARVRAEDRLELVAPAQLNIVCFRYQGAAETSDALNAGIVVALHESGIAAPSTTTLDGRLAIRAAIVNHRTQAADIDALVDATLRFGAEADARLTTDR